MDCFNAKKWFKKSPDWATEIAVDSDGSVWAHEYAPHVEEDYYWWSKGKTLLLGKVPCWEDACISREEAEAMPDSSNESDLLAALKGIINATDSAAYGKAYEKARELVAKIEGEK